VKPLATLQVVLQDLLFPFLTTFVVIEDVETDNWGIAGETVTARRKRTK
jgi:phenylpyruvate tautomerase PptA (4-oxalocrotonate tautomerase family)